jgi:hypothetical protein
MRRHNEKIFALRAWCVITMAIYKSQSHFCTDVLRERFPTCMTSISLDVDEAMGWFAKSLRLKPRSKKGAIPCTQWQSLMFTDAQAIAHPML